MKARQGFTSSLIALNAALVISSGAALMLTPAVSWSFDDGSAPASATSSTPVRVQRRGAARIPHPAPSSQAATDGKRLALQAPPLDHVMDRQKLRYILADSGADADDAQSVNVKGKAPGVMVPMGQLYALPWAFVHPTQAWRIFMPIPQQ